MSEGSLIHKETRYVENSIENLQISQHLCPVLAQKEMH
jgi:hypothetical protein